MQGGFHLPQAALGWGAEVRAIVDSGLPGPKGNREFFLHAFQRESPEPAAELDRWIAEAVDG